MGKLPDMLFLELGPVVVHPGSAGALPCLHVPILVGVVKACFAIVRCECAVAVDVAVQDSVGFVAPQLSVSALGVFVQMDLRLKGWHSQCCQCRQCGSVVGLACQCIIFREMLELTVGNVGVVRGRLGDACGIVRTYIRCSALHSEPLPSKV